MMFLSLMITIYLIDKTLAVNKCIESASNFPKYNLIGKCRRSTLGIAGKANFTTLPACKRFGIQKKALALNFSSQRVYNESDPVDTCEVLKCAETLDGLFLRNDSRFDYYSLYGHPLPSINATCVPAIGMFSILPNLNYIDAETKCRNISGILADVTSERRTEALAQVLTNAGVNMAYVGMWGANRVFHTTNGDTLVCTTYRAWSPGHPRMNPEMTCVVLTRQRMWKSTSCKRQLPAICELLPGGPYRRGSIFNSKPLNSEGHILT